MSEHVHKHELDLKELGEELRSKSQKMTGPRFAVLKVLQAKQAPMTNKEIHQSLPENMCDLATVYRSISWLEKMGMVTKYDFGDGVARFELHAPGEDGHHHHLVCTSCTAIIELDGCFQQELEESLAKKHGFKSITHKLEFFGVCPACQ
ncbi:transcriptional repressor [Verrucomicrobia bacterium]|nr:transcriptional repressor [Verrucomicrobiota bacterium]